MSYRAIFPEAMIYSFEPQSDCYQQLRSNLVHDPKQRCFNLALGSAPGSMTMHRSAFSASSSLLEMADLHKDAFPFTAPETLERVEVDTLDRIAGALDLQREILLKIDTQGYEKSVLLGGIQTLELVRLVIVELSFSELYRGQPLYAEVAGFLASLGFEYRGSVGQLYHPADGTPLQQDSTSCARWGREIRGRL